MNTYHYTNQQAILFWLCWVAGLLLFAGSVVMGAMTLLSVPPLGLLYVAIVLAQLGTLVLLAVRFFWHSHPPDHLFKWLGLGVFAPIALLTLSNVMYGVLAYA